MSFTATLFVALGAYVVFLGAVMYFCVYADPDESRTALFLTETLPEICWSALERNLPKGLLKMVTFVTERFLTIFYCAILMGAWSIIMAYVYPWVDRQSYVSDLHKYSAAATFAACVVSYRYACTTSPGIITARNIRRYDHFPYDHLMFVPGGRCKTTGIPRLARSKFDRHRYKENVPRFDHFCGWVYNTIGEENYRFFLLFVLTHLWACAYGTYVLGNLFYGHVLENNMMDAVFVDRHTGEEVAVTKLLLFQYLFDRHLWPAAVLILMAVMTVALGMFLLYHVWLTNRGLTTNEAYKWDQVQKWYKRELKRYNDAMARGDIGTAANKSNGNKPVVSDGDVTCIGAVNEGSEKQASTQGKDCAPQKTESSEDEPIEHPGPEPKNLYDRGWKENWKEVLFPISLRKQVVRKDVPPRPPENKMKTT